MNVKSKQWIDLEQSCKLVPVNKTNPQGELEAQRLPESVKYIDKGGCLVINEELVDNGRITKVTSYLPPNPYENRHWTQEQMEKECIKYEYYISNIDGGYVGDEKEYKFLVKKKKLILIQKSDENHSTCSIGYNVEENKWCGWSHRAIYGFTIGDEVHEDDLTSKTGFIEEYAIQHPEECKNLPIGFKAFTLNDAKRMAIAFAQAVS